METTNSVCEEETVPPRDEAEYQRVVDAVCKALVHVYHADAGRLIIDIRRPARNGNADLVIKAKIDVEKLNSEHASRDGH